jgi:hypothetical protein
MWRRRSSNAKITIAQYERILLTSMLRQVLLTHTSDFNRSFQFKLMPVTLMEFPVEAAWKINQLLRKAKECEQHGEQGKIKHSDMLLYTSLTGVLSQLATTGMHIASTKYLVVQKIASSQHNVEKVHTPSFPRAGSLFTYQVCF